MKGKLVYSNEQGWQVKWSDIESFAHGTIWEYTPIHENTFNLLEGDTVEFELVDDTNHFFTEKDINFDRYAKIISTNAKPLSAEELSSSKARTTLRNVDEQQLMKDFIGEFADNDGRFLPCNPDAVFNWFAWRLWRKI